MFSGVIEQIGGRKQVKTLRYVKEVGLFLFFFLKPGLWTKEVYLLSVLVKNDFHDTVVSLGKYFTRKSELPEKLFLKVFY